MSENEEQMRRMPSSDLDLQMMLVDPEWGRDVAPELKDKLSVNLQLKTDGSGQYQVSKKHLWGLLSYYTRDVRLGNLNNDQFLYTQAWTDFAGDCLRWGYVKSFLTALSRVATVIELSQSRNGFLRKRIGTFTKEEYHEFSEPPKKGIMGGSKKKGGNF
jgi:hypothetical protein